MNDPDGTGTYQPGDTQPPAGTEVTRPLPKHIGRYRIERVLGRGGFGLVYLARDDQLDRLVAVKVPHPERVTQPGDAGAYLAEARIVAGLDHPHIVPVYDVGSTEEYPCFIVTKFVEGRTLAHRIADGRPTFAEAAGLVATVAEALHYAHRKGLVHRDVKPGNILIDASGRPFLVDFGLALREDSAGLGPRYAGTSAYMSPEQARGEGHRVDGRSDIFSLGVVFYELLTGRRPFRADSLTGVMEQATSHEPRPPRQLDEAIPKELERICFKALSKRASERYLTARDMADDLRHFLEGLSATQQPAPDAEGRAPRPAGPVAQPPSTSHPSGRSGVPSASAATSYGAAIRIVPKGLRSFDAHDADFFLELLPGPRDRDGLPDGIRFWKTRAEEKDPEKTFSVGLLWGPSGCGKSSLVKAGLLPRLSGDVVAVYLEATAGETEARLLNGLRKRCPALPADLGLTATLAALRRGQGVAAGTKVLIVLDQFEQWLHARKDEADAELVRALRQCDGGRVQCVVMVRDDFWMAVIRFMRELEVRLVEGQNSAAVDLFDADHARKVLAAFGRAFGKLPENVGEAGKEQREFLRQAVAGLAQDGKVVPVRLALFAEMMKGKAWTPASLQAVGGTEGVGVTFLEETFSAATAPPEHRYHQKAARAGLKILLPETGGDIKGHMRSHAELLEASGYADRPADFDDLVRILDNEIRLITPTDPEGKEADGEPARRAEPGQRYYQLTHDYLVHPVREWLTRKQRESRRGRAELLLADRAAVWNARPENRQLPSLSQWFQIRWLTQARNWTPPQKKMMARAGRYHAVRVAAATVLLAVAAFAGLAVRERVAEQRNATRAAGLVQRLLDAETAQVPGVVAEMSGYRRWADSLLREEYDRAGPASRQRLHASLALLPVDPGQVDYLSRRLLEAQPHEVPVIRDALVPHRDALLGLLWAAAESPAKGKESQRLRAAAALAKYDPEGGRWAGVQRAVANDLVAVPAVYLSAWMESLAPVRRHLLDPLSETFRDPGRREVERSLAADILADYAADDPKRLAGLLTDADDKQFAVLYPRFAEQGGKELPVLLAVLDTKLSPEVPSADERREKLARRQANAAVALLRMNHPERVWPLLRRGKEPDDPRVRSLLIHQLGPLGADAGPLAGRLGEEPDVTIRRALVLGLGELGEKGLPPDARAALLPKLQAAYRTDPDPGLHAAAEWSLRTWQQDAWLRQVNEEWAKDRGQRAGRLREIEQLVGKEKAPPRWFVNSQGQTFVVLPGPAEFVMGSPPSEAGRQEGEIQHRKRIGRTFAVAAKSVTVEQYRQFDPAYQLPAAHTRLPDLPVAGIDWYKAAAYCNWLSGRDGIPADQWCYETEPRGETGPAVKVVRLRENYLSLRGYRLPTEAEMEYSTRAGAVTSRYFGETDDLLPKYAWYVKNSGGKPWPVGSKKPNDWGLFDTQGNVFTWCQERIKGYPLGNETTPDTEDGLEIESGDIRLLRGSSFNHPAPYVRSAYRNLNVPTLRSYDNGFRPARTLVP